MSFTRSPQYLSPLAALFPSLSICNECEGLSCRRPKPLRNLQRGSQHGCGFCKVISNGVMEYGKTLKGRVKESFKNCSDINFEYITDFACGLVLNDSNKTHKFSLELCNNVVDTTTLQFEPGEIGPEFFSQPLRNVPTRLDLCRVGAYAQHWLKDCTNRHAKCESKEGTVLPSRVIDISKKSQNTIKLVQTTGRRASYAALSYCWGTTSANLQTTSAQLPQHLRGIPWDLLPQCFQDAIQICWALDIGYLWIDSLCIIQDSVEDWEIESAGMASVYGNALITIAASSSAHPGVGLFGARHTRPLFVQVETGSVFVKHENSVFRFKSRSQGAHDITNGSSDFIWQRDNAPLSTRGWAYQERMLSARTLHFHADELVWECGTSIRCECGEIDDDLRVPVIEVRSQRNRIKSDVCFVDLVDGQRPSAQDLRNTWLELISQYSQLDLTYESDRLVALSGLAARFTRPSLGEYVAGIWIGMLPAAFSYFIWEYNDSSVRPTNFHYRASSWSWASAPLYGRSQICYLAHKANILWQDCQEFGVIGVKYTIPGRNTFNWVEHATLRIRGKYISCRMILERNELYNSEARFFLFLMDVYEQNHGHRKTRISEPCLLDSGTQLSSNRAVIFLNLGSRYGLILEESEAEGQKPVTFRRLGLVRLVSEDETWQSSSVLGDFDLI